MKRPIHKYNNGIQCFKDTIYEAALERYYTSINLHEPFEETVFDHILKNSEIRTFVDIGSAWGYYSLKAKFFDRTIKVLGIDGDQNMVKYAHANALLNDISDIDFRYAVIPKNISLLDIILETEKIDLIKIDIQGDATDALRSANGSIAKINNIIVGTHGSEHDDCIKLLLEHGFQLKLNLTSDEIPIQPDGLLWAFR
ncbi:MAG TPA: hypothetical protein DHU78_08805 [Opitutae bacterium]|nr:hypothetical protein [Opitutae bacterium]|tara:strand:- start:21541 stop:22134 length:594 start_codon:yes stop_codon:yes gene_type:complete